MKDVWYQLRILQPLNRTVLEEMAHDAEVLGELLGSEHDLDFLRARLEKESGDEALADELAQLQKLISKRCKRLRRDALELGRRFYAEPSKAFAKRISIFAGKRTKGNNERWSQSASEFRRAAGGFSGSFNHKIFRPFHPGAPNFNTRIDARHPAVNKCGPDYTSPLLVWLRLRKLQDI